MDVKILGIGCPRCRALGKKVRGVAVKNNIDIEIEKVTDINEIIKYNIMMTPGLVINNEVKCSGFIPKDEQILEWLDDN